MRTCQPRKDLAQAHVVNSLDVLKLQPQPVEDCLEKLGYLLAGGDTTPAVVGVHAHELAKTKKVGNGLEVCIALTINSALRAVSNITQEQEHL